LRRPRSRATAAGLATALALAGGPTPCSGLRGAAPAVALAAGAVLEVAPGSLVRWAGAGLTACGLGERRFPPLDGACYYPVDLLRGEGALELRRFRGDRAESRRVRVGRYPYPIQRLTVPKGYVELSPQNLARVQRENREIARLWGRSGPRRFALPLAPPLDPLPEGGRFGSRRVINGQPRSPHSGVDFGAPAGTPVRAAAAGTVALVAEHFFGGRSVFLDHGDGLITMYLHLRRAAVAEGASVERGQVVGEVGSTGRATGPHLHFGVRWRAARVDPTLLLGEPAALPQVD
jgi:murein DD-endopeptidase MepM/ murein hydrolase activator NlpD